MNKHLITQIISIFFCITCGIGCIEKHHSYPTTMVQADSLVENEHEKALVLLQTLQDSINEMPEETRMYYNLLCLKVKDKSYITHTSDSLISQIVDFYKEYGDQEKLMEAYYYMGRVNRDLEDAPRALKYFHKAIDVSKNTKRYNLLSRVYSQKGTLYAMQDMNEEAMSMFNKALYYAKQAQDNIAIMFTMRDIARIYNAVGETNSAVLFYTKAHEAAKVTKQIKNILDIQCEMSWVYIKSGRYSEAFEYLYPTLNYKLGRDSCFTDLGLGVLHLKVNKLDSALFYLNKALKSKSIYTINITYSSLSKLKESQKKYKESIKYARLHQKSMDSIKKISTSNEIRKIRSLYNYQKKEKENQLLKLENTKKQLFIQKLVSIILMIVFSFTIIAFIWNRKKNKYIAQSKRVQIERESQYKQSMEYLNKNTEKLEIMEISLFRVKEQKDNAQQDLIETQKKLLEKKNQQILLKHRNQHLLMSDFNTSAIYLKFHTSSNIETAKISETDWEILQQELDITYDNFTGRLYALMPQLSLLELRICYLIKSSIKVGHMAILLNRSKSTISSSRHRLYKKLTSKDGTPEEFDDFIKSM